MTIITNDISEAITLLRRGGLVAEPTETVYGLAADASNETAVKAIFKAKKRPFDHPLIVHLADAEELDEWAQDIPDAAYVLAKQFWPGPLTLILKKQADVLDIVTGGQTTIGVRIPRHPIASALLKAYGRGLAAPSANQFTHISPTTAQAVYEELNGRIDLILEGGDCEVGLESTILDLTSAIPTILRPGMITASMISNCLNLSVNKQAMDVKLKVPGMHHVHYAPQTRAYVIAADELNAFLVELDATQFPLVLMTHDDHHIPAHFPHHHLILSNDPHHYAHDLYRVLRDFDHGQFKTMVIISVPYSSEWDAIRDRLSKATCPVG
jgi:L-threonylcarbamoyladenylate synthase